MLHADIHGQSFNKQGRTSIIRGAFKTINLAEPSLLLRTRDTNISLHTFRIEEGFEIDDFGKKKYKRTNCAIILSLHLIVIWEYNLLQFNLLCLYFKFPDRRFLNFYNFF